ncbi:unnamed protein product [Bursaphelenchus okinawaensis]|uniref:Uncharacterized protein n=1 Tax=Bursaphelenchus okinawaensis TaxID=465554 RepID=A0A811LAV7_9BILA|nr:unnamed protein product [Bursaphelenchus okinawaensis]CAG9119795.1 unnamed protein product [Bursaphelenchus okinawaensis]
MKGYSLYDRTDQDCGFGRIYNKDSDECTLDKFLLTCGVIAAVLLFVILPAAIGLVVYCIKYICQPKWATGTKSTNKTSDERTPRSIYSRKKQEVNKYLKKQHQKSGKVYNEKTLPVRKGGFVKATSKSKSDYEEESE